MFQTCSQMSPLISNMNHRRKHVRKRMRRPFLAQLQKRLREGGSGFSHIHHSPLLHLRRSRLRGTAPLGWQKPPSQGPVPSAESRLWSRLLFRSLVFTVCYSLKASVAAILLPVITVLRTVVESLGQNGDSSASGPYVLCRTDNANPANRYSR